MHKNIDKWPYKWITGFIVLLVGAITIFITGRGSLSGSIFVPKKSTSMKTNSMPAENSTKPPVATKMGNPLMKL